MRYGNQKEDVWKFFINIFLFGPPSNSVTGREYKRLGANIFVKHTNHYTVFREGEIFELAEQTTRVDSGPSVGQSNANLTSNSFTNPSNNSGNSSVMYEPLIRFAGPATLIEPKGRPSWSSTGAATA